MKARNLLVMVMALLVFIGEARTGTIKEETFACKISEQAKQIVENYVRKKYDSVRCDNDWMKIDSGVRKKCSRIDAAGYDREFYADIFCDGRYRLCTAIFMIMEQGEWRDLLSQPP